jgi:hypothetical protein
MIDASLIPAYVASGAAALGTIFAIVRNGSRQKRQNIEFKTELSGEIKHVKKQLDDPNNGLSAIMESINSVKLNCAKTSSTFETEIKNSQKDIEELQKRGNRR